MIAHVRELSIDLCGDAAMHLTILTVPLSNKNAIYKVYTVYTHSMSAWSLVLVMSDAQEI